MLVMARMNKVNTTWTKGMGLMQSRNHRTTELMGPLKSGLSFGGFFMWQTKIGGTLRQ